MAAPAEIDRQQLMQLVYQNPDMSRADIARELGVSRQAIAYHLDKLGAPKKYAGARAAREHMPWSEMPAEHKKSPEWRKLLWHLEYVLTGGGEMSRDKLERVAGFYNELERFNSIVRYDPSVLPRRGQSGGGWEYVPREKSDKDLVIRVDENTEISKKDYGLWRIPEIRPEV